MATHQDDTCTKCGQTDNHPKFHLIGANDDGSGLGWETMHHDCAAAQGHYHAHLIVKHTDGAKGDQLRKLLEDPKHPVHAKIDADIAEFEKETRAAQRKAEKENG